MILDPLGMEEDPMCNVVKRDILKANFLRRELGGLSATISLPKTILKQLGQLAIPSGAAVLEFSLNRIIRPPRVYQSPTCYMHLPHVV